MRARNLIPLMIIQITLFVIAAIVHRGAISSSYIHPQAQVAETVIAAILALGLCLTFYFRKGNFSYARIAQGFALIGTIVAVIMMLIGVGPRSAFDYGLHIIMIISLVGGLLITPSQPAVDQPGHAV